MALDGTVSFALQLLPAQARTMTPRKDHLPAHAHESRTRQGLAMECGSEPLARRGCVQVLCSVLCRHFGRGASATLTTLPVRASCHQPCCGACLAVVRCNLGCGHNQATALWDPSCDQWQQAEATHVRRRDDPPQCLAMQAMSTILVEYLACRSSPMWGKPGSTVLEKERFCLSVLPSTRAVGSDSAHLTGCREAGLC